MPEGPDGEEFGPASKFFANLEYYEAMGKDLRLAFEDIADKRLILGYNFDRGDFIETSLGFNVYVTHLTGVTVEQVTIDSEPMDEIVEWVEGGFTFAQNRENDGSFTEATEVEIVD